ncbi:protease Do-like 8, chloroplastic, partial [Phalaenopsis equestris]|uniref:protease Do-like 8, chloroplastic n=1 Tax=Phalaenopsis equestris TaxID=78828 RepID=UPI0009E4FE25
TSAGVGFAIPSSTVLKIVPQLIKFGKAVRAGLNIEVASDLVANQLNVRKGALVLQVTANSLAAKAGLLPTRRGFTGNILLGDIILAVDEKPVSF